MTRYRQGNFFFHFLFSFFGGLGGWRGGEVVFDVLSVVGFFLLKFNADLG